MAIVRIRRQLWTVREVPDVVDAAGHNASRRDRNVGLDGICQFDRLEILVAAPLEPQPKLETYVHELLHAAQPKMRESTVVFTARVIADGLYQHGARITL
ncbi:hypothetical protein UFOVP1287_72 [uncultured Caudovirales phage]|uniref:Uncharacterized protein n=1 Tax=uncultured Caudovirales phage TaxID=2100421 RepID=A0A6J5RFN2_9CAUD|nr:hypothetical protein UFOVP1287_72 [uncultured Caudovirales phage]CAB4205206.1 hypothetical protein UFOVP1408_41 [uncultured Caudovirales phage]